MNKKLLLPVALFAATTLGGTAYINSKDNDNKNRIELTEQKDKQIDEKGVFDYMKYTSVPIKEKNNNGLNLAMGLFGIGLAAAKRKEFVLNELDEIEEFARKTPIDKDGSVDTQLIDKCQMLRKCILDKNDNDRIHATAVAMRIEEYVKANLNNNTNWSRAYLNANNIIATLDDPTIEQANDKYRKECLTALDNVNKGVTEISRNNSYYNAIATKAEIKKLYRLIEEGESDYPELKEQIFELLDKYTELIDHIPNLGYDRTAQAMYSRVPKLNWFVAKYTTTKQDWDSGENKTKFCYPVLEDYTHDNDDYLQFSSATLKLCRQLRSDIKMNDTHQVGLIINIIKSDMMKHGTYDNKAFANAMLYCDYILNMCNPAGGRFNGSLSELTRNVKDLFENIYLSVTKPDNFRPYGTVPATFEEWNREMERIERSPNHGNSGIEESEEWKRRHGMSGHGCTTLGDIAEQRRKEEAYEKERSYIKEAPSCSTSKKANKSKITFANVGGQDKAIEQLKKKVLYPVKYPNAFRNRMLSRGIIMYGRPGTGKTLVALALSNEADAKFIKINASELTTSLHGETDKNWRDLFRQAREQQPCIIFIDEFDTVAQKRGHNATNNYDDTVLNTILTEMSDIEKNGDNIFVIGATNRFEVLDSGITRAGRFGTHIELKAPETTKDVLQIFDIHTQDKPLDSDVDKEKLAKMMLAKNVTGSDIASIVNEALENTFLRLGIYEKMEDGTFNDNDLSDIKTTMGDFADAIENFESTSDKKAEKHTIIGFNKR